MAGINLNRLTILAVALWIALLVYLANSVVNVGQKPVDDDQTRQHYDSLIRQLQIAKDDTELLRQDNINLQRLLKTADSERASPGTQTNARSASPILSISSSGESTRRRLHNGIQELWFATRKLIQNLANDESAKNRALRRITEQYRTVIADSIRLSQASSASSDTTRVLRNLTDLVQARIRYIQNPADCSKAKTFTCNLNKGCGFGCQIHHAAYCLVLAYAGERFLLLDTSGWRYAKSGGWESVFQKTSEKCESGYEASPVALSSLSQPDPVVSIPIVDALRNPPPQMPLAFPSDLAPTLLQHHGNPAAWWLSQFVWYLMRPSEKSKEYLDALTEKHKLGDGHALTVGIHVRRTDKVGSEAAFHHIDEYMFWAEEWFAIQELVLNRTLSRRAYIATDDKNLLAEAKAAYPRWELLGDATIAETAQLGKRYSDESLRGIIVDIDLLSKCDYLVCTFSSQVCRVSYELMQVARGDVADAFHSLDDIYYYGGQLPHQQQAIYDHQGDSVDKGEIDLKAGDIVGIAGNHWDGQSKGVNTRDRKSGLYPSYKAAEHWRIVDFPTYPNVNL